MTSKTDMAVLGMLTIEPMSGYDMKRLCERSFAHFWHESFGSIYPGLQRLKAQGFVCARHETRPNAPDAIVYSLTPSGRARFLEWMEEPPAPERIRSELMLKIFFGGQVRAELSAERIRTHQRELLRVGQAYAEIERMIDEESAESADAPFWRMTLRRGQLLTEARLRWSHEALEMLHEREEKIPA